MESGKHTIHMIVSALRDLIKLLVEAKSFDEWLTPDVVALLLAHYAKKSPTLGALTWEYSDRLGDRVWGQYQPYSLTLFVSKNKTKDRFKAQVLTILHEIQHWNQHCDIVNTSHPAQTLSNMELRQAFVAQYSAKNRVFGYQRNPFEVDARAFASKHLEEAMNQLGKHYSGKLEGGSIDGVVEELFDEYADEGIPLSRLKIGHALRDHDLNTPDNMKSVVDQFKALDVPVR